MTEYNVTYTGNSTASYVGGNGKRINFERGETKKLRKLPPEARNVEDYEGIAGWRIEEKQKSTSKSEDGGDN